MDQIINEITDYFVAENKQHSICDLVESDQLLYYKLVAILNGEEADISDDEILKIKCVKLLFDYRHKKKIRPIDVITAGDYPLALTKILKNNSFQDVGFDKDLLKYAVEYGRKSCVKALKNIKKKINEINKLMDVHDCTSIIDLFLNGEP